jgi:hypothetical protein
MAAILGWTAFILGGAYLTFIGTASLGTRKRQGGVEIAVPSLVAAFLAALAWVVATSSLAIIVSTIT